MINAPHNWILTIAGALSALASMMHLAMIFGGSAWYRFFGAGERLAEMADAGHWYPPVITVFIALVLAIWSLYAFAGAGLIRPLPLTKLALVFITMVYLVRGLIIVPLFFGVLITPSSFWWWSSIIALFYGLTHLIGLIQVWGRL